MAGVLLRTLHMPPRQVHPRLGAWSYTVPVTLAKIWGGPQSWGYPKMDGLFHGKSHLEMDDLGVIPIYGIHITSQECQQSVAMLTKIRFGDIHRHVPLKV